MKKIIARISVLLVLVAVSLGTEAMAQRYGMGRRGGGHYHSGYHGHSFSRAVDDLDAVATGALAMYALGSLDDYTGIRFGVNSAALRVNNFDGADESKKGGVDLGIVFGWYLGNTPFILEPGVFYSFKGGTIDDGYEVVEHNMHMLEFPIVLKCEVPLLPGAVALQPFAGCFFSSGFSGKTTISGTEINGSHYEDKVDTFDNGVLESFDCGLRFGCGLCISRFYAEFAYDLGLCDVTENCYDCFANGQPGSLNTRTMSFNIGFNF